MTKLSRETIRFVESLVSSYSEYDRLAGCYTININSLPDFDRDELVGMIIVDEPDLLTEALGPDNRYWDKVMQPSIVSLFKPTTSHDESKDKDVVFISSMKKGIFFYLMNTINEVLNTVINDYNSDHGCVYTDQGPRRDYKQVGILPW